MMKLNKKGSGATTAAIWVLVVVVIAMFGLGVVYVPKLLKSSEQTSFTGGAGTNADDIAAALKTGDAASLRIYVTDEEAANTGTKVAAPIYCYDETGKFADNADGTVSSTSSATQVNTVIGKTLTCQAINKTFYGDKQVVPVKEDNVPVTLVAHRVCSSTGGTITYYDKNGANEANLTLAANEESYFGKMEFRISSANCAYNLAGFYIDTVTGTNISNIDMSGTADVIGQKGHPDTNIVKGKAKYERIKDVDDYVFEIDDNSAQEGNQPLMMHQYDYLNTGSVTVLADADGTSGVGDTMTTYAFDKTSFRSYKVEAIFDNAVEDDQDSPSDIGAADIQDLDSVAIK
jgi:hypothetical protein